MYLNKEKQEEYLYLKENFSNVDKSNIVNKDKLDTLQDILQKAIDNNCDEAIEYVEEIVELFPTLKVTVEKSYSITANVPIGNEPSHLVINEKKYEIDSCYEE